MQFNLEPVKEPKGFIKILQFVFAILAFATTTSFSTHFSFHATLSGCNNTGGHDVVRQSVSYPFALDHVFKEQEVCVEPATTIKFHFQTDTSSDAQFFVGVGVVCTIYAALALAGYCFCTERCNESRVIPTVDFILHGVLAVMWLAAASAWADGVGTLKAGCDPTVWLSQVCGDKQNLSCEFLSDDSSGTFAKLHISLLFGFLNLFLWASNMWFLYKETPYFKGDQPPPPTEGGNIGNI